jgi:hypothetical protein
MFGQSGHGGEIERRRYLIDHFQVTFQHGAAWNCSCREFVAIDSCRHTREAAGMREAQAGMKRRIESGTSGLRTYTERGR